ncbi:MAG TPA: 6-bladed beta-propeller [Acidobacteriota bacterium]|nr:6-bladed beta-propeller [Acidobacteriota bacterium]
MKKFIFLVFFLLILILFIFSQEIIENPNKPLNPNAGRILELKEVLRISDEGEEFFFKRPQFPKVAENGFIFLHDSNQFLKFTPEGQFVKNLLKKGQGPGEIQQFSRYVLQGEDIYIFDIGNSKILHMDLEGELLDEFRLTERYSLLLGLLGDHFVMTKTNFPEAEERTGNFIDAPEYIVVLSKDEEVIKKFPSAVMRAYRGENVMVSWGRSITIMSHDGRHCIWTDPEEYMVTVLNIKTGEVVSKFTRQYSRVKAPERETAKPGSKIPKRKYLSDITYIYTFQGNILVWTSTFDEKKGMLFDLFDKKGTFLDSFWLNVKGTLIGTHEGFLFFRESNEDGTMDLTKYQVVDEKWKY